MASVTRVHVDMRVPRYLEKCAVSFEPSMGRGRRATVEKSTVPYSAILIGTAAVCNRPAGHGFSADHYARVSHHHFAITRNITRCGVLDKFGCGSAQALGGGQHCHCGAEAAHTDVFAHDDVKQSARIQGQDSLDGFVVFHPGDLVALVMVHVAGGDDQDGSS